MKISSLFDLIADAKDLGDMFKGAESREQMVSLLERLKHGQNPEDLLACLAGLETSVTKALEDTLEMSAVVDDDDLVDDDADLEAEIDRLASEATAEANKITTEAKTAEGQKQKSSVETPDTDPKNNVQS
jgi:hypothetical protein